MTIQAPVIPAAHATWLGSSASTGVVVSLGTTTCRRIAGVEVGWVVVGILGWWFMTGSCLGWFLCWWKNGHLDTWTVLNGHWWNRWWWWLVHWFYDFEGTMMYGYIRHVRLIWCLMMANDGSVSPSPHRTMIFPYVIVRFSWSAGMGPPSTQSVPEQDG